MKNPVPLIYHWCLHWSDSCWNRLDKTYFAEKNFEDWDSCKTFVPFPTTPWNSTSRTTGAVVSNQRTDWIQQRPENNTNSYHGTPPNSWYLPNRSRRNCSSTGCSLDIDRRDLEYSKTRSWSYYSIWSHSLRHHSTNSECQRMSTDIRYGNWLTAWGSRHPTVEELWYAPFAKREQLLPTPLSIAELQYKQTWVFEIFKAVLNNYWTTPLPDG